MRNRYQQNCEERTKQDRFDAVRRAHGADGRLEVSEEGEVSRKQWAIRKALRERGFH